jgi:hypothetical protein
VVGAKREYRVVRLSFCDAQIAADRIRFAQIEALREEREPPEPVDELGRHLASLFATMTADPDLFRAALEHLGTLTPIQQIVRRPRVAHAVRTAMDALRDSAPIEMPGPDRRELLDIVT